MSSRAVLSLTLAATALLAACGRQVAVPAPDAPAQVCDAVTLPATVAGAGLRPTSEAGTAAWGEPPITYRCGVSRPAALAPTSQLLDVAGVGWLPIEGVGGTGFIAATWPTQSDPVYVEVLVPEDYSAPADVLIDISAALDAAAG
ncbi:MAG: hypothetical protein RL134_1526 [Actinomycetota bacterium]|jgi:hypothetical protein